MNIKISKLGELLNRKNDEFLYIPLPSDKRPSTLLTLSTKFYEETENFIPNISFPCFTLTLNLPCSELLIIWTENGKWNVYLIDSKTFAVKKMLKPLHEFRCLPPIYSESCIYFVTSSSKSYKNMIIWQLILIENRWRKLSEFQGDWSINSFVFFNKSLLFFGLKQGVINKYDIIADCWSEIPFNISNERKFFAFNANSTVIVFDKSGAILESLENNDYNWKKIGSLSTKTENYQFFLRPISQSFRENSVFFAYSEAENEEIEIKPFYYMFNLANKSFETVKVKKQSGCDLF